MNTRIAVEPARAQRGYGLFLAGHDEANNLVYVTGVVLQTTLLKDQPAYHTPAPVTLWDEEAQMLMDSLWQAGLRPSSGEGNTAHMTAKDAHLDDLRRVLFFHLGITKS